MIQEVTREIQYQIISYMFCTWIEVLVPVALNGLNIKLMEIVQKKSVNRRSSTGRDGRQKFSFTCLLKYYTEKVGEKKI